jgi:aspartate-semialdehyde dehydrogenase
MPSLTLIQAPVFHSHSFSFFLEIPGVKEITDLEGALDCDSLEVVSSPDEPPSPVQVAGTDRIQLGGMKRDLFCSDGIWLWAAADNLRLSAINAVSALEHFMLKDKV